MDATSIVIIVSFIVTVISTIMLHIAKNIWRDQKKTQLFALICIISVLTFMILLYPRLPD